MPETVLRQLTFVIDVMDVDDGDERLDLKRSSEIGLARADNNFCRPTGWVCAFGRNSQPCAHPPVAGILPGC